MEIGSVVRAVQIRDDAGNIIHPADQNEAQQALIDDTIKGFMRSIGDAGATPTNTTGATVLNYLNAVADYTSHTRKSQAVPQSAYDSSTAASLTVAINVSTGWKGVSVVEVWVKSSAAADFTVQGSVDNVDYRDVDTISLGAAGEEHRGYRNAYPYIRVTTAAANDNEIEIVVCGA